ncbi:GTPase [Desulfuribacillus alkaliarsenatis]|uniref:G domain-containing protein n=1 Tax=Desulfuribacillus alkaliarsenatis TaxID=766136 RepID=A0A1E5FZZ6_9FIRM|nr:GTPase [Desulfuribacillus alkaliarsenatis]OEF96165.1 hypothetical protein BHF68_08330 [Desulfuribacillus alkaliarsenatis]
MTEKFEIHEWAVRGNALLERSKAILSSAPSEKVKNISNRIPECVLDNENGITLVFAGQYSAGKSSILKVLTERENIAVGGGITTEITHTYDWNGIKVIDTPGVHTELRPDHDEITYRAIADADLLVFVITNELFDSHLAKHFRKLAIERNKAYEMMLVINKMRRCAKGNCSESQNVIREDIKKVLSPFTPEDLRTSFIDAEAALDSKVEVDSDISKIMWRKSGIDSFTENLNDFVREKGLTGRYSTALYTLEQLLQEALASEAEGDKDVEALEELLLQRRRALIESKDSIPRAVEGEIQQSCSEIRHEGRKISDMINATANQKTVDQELQMSQDRVQQITEQLGHTIQVVIGKHIDDLEKRIDGIANSELAKELLPRLEHRIKEASITPDTMSKMQTASDVSSKLGEFLVRNSFASNSGSMIGLFKLNQYSGTSTHNAVKVIGNFFGKKFKPWEAVKWTRNVANVGRVFVIVGTVLTFALQIKEDADAAQLESDLRESRAAVRLGFNDAAHAIEMHYDKATQTYISSTFSGEIEDVDKQLSELRDMQEVRSNLFENILELLEKTRYLIRDLHSTESKIYNS